MALNTDLNTLTRWKEHSTLGLAAFLLDREAATPGVEVNKTIGHKI
jgi:hypothetical protein